MRASYIQFRLSTSHTSSKPCLRLDSAFNCIIVFKRLLSDSCSSSRGWKAFFFLLTTEKERVLPSTFKISSKTLLPVLAHPFWRITHLPSYDQFKPADGEIMLVESKMIQVKCRTRKDKMAASVSRIIAIPEILAYAASSGLKDLFSSHFSSFFHRRWSFGRARYSLWGSPRSLRLLHLRELLRHMVLWSRLRQWRWLVLWSLVVGTEDRLAQIPECKFVSPLLVAQYEFVFGLSVVKGRNYLHASQESLESGRLCRGYCSWSRPRGWLSGILGK